MLQKRILIGALATAGLAAFGLVPTSQLRPKPSKPLFFFLVPLLRIQELLNESRGVIENGDWATLRILLQRVKDQPNNAQVVAAAG